MRCPYCGHTDDKVIDSRPSRDLRSVRRRRECIKCTKRFTTYEYVEEIQLHITKRDGKVEPYDRAKLARGLRVAAAKRPVKMDDIDQLVDDVERKLHAKAEKEVTSREIGEYVMKGLKALDEIAYIRYASVYRRFEDAGDFTEEVKRLS
ncbi:transcriptional regulator NrdR [bacterium]|nr:transcriptional regulator NrdR [bacterium]